MKLKDFGLKNVNKKEWKTTGAAIFLAAFAIADLWHFHILDHAYDMGAIAAALGLLIAPDRMINFGFKKAGEEEK